MAEGDRTLKTTEGPTTVVPRSIPWYRAQSLTQGGNLAHVDLDGQVYTLRITRAGKLILTK